MRINEITAVTFLVIPRPQSCLNLDEQIMSSAAESLRMEKAEEILKEKGYPSLTFSMGIRRDRGNEGRSVAILNGEVEETKLKSKLPLENNVRFIAGYVGHLFPEEGIILGKVSVR